MIVIRGLRFSYGEEEFSLEISELVVVLKLITSQFGPSVIESFVTVNFPLANLAEHITGEWATARANRTAKYAKLSLNDLGGRAA